MSLQEDMERELRSALAPALWAPELVHRWIPWEQGEPGLRARRPSVAERAASIATMREGGPTTFEAWPTPTSSMSGGYRDPWAAAAGRKYKQQLHLAGAASMLVARVCRPGEAPSGKQTGEFPPGSPASLILGSGAAMCWYSLTAPRGWLSPELPYWLLGFPAPRTTSVSSGTR